MITSSAIAQQGIIFGLHQNKALNFTGSNDQANGLVSEKKADAGVVNRLIAMLNADDYQVVKNSIVFNPTEIHFAVTENRHSAVLQGMDRHLVELEKSPNSIYFKPLEKWFGAVGDIQFPYWVKWSALFSLLFIVFLIIIKYGLNYRVKQKTQQLKDEIIEKERYQFLINRIPIGVYLFVSSPDGSMRFDYVNSQFCKIYDLKQEDFFRDPSLAFTATHPEDYDSLIAANKYATETGETFIWEGRFVVNNKCKWVNINSEPSILPDGDILWSGLMKDITELQLAKDKLKEIATTDRLTQLKNRAFCEDALKSEIKRFDRSGYMFSLIMLDIDHFKQINDTYGHTAGDQVLITTSKILEENIRDTDLAGRWGGEEFIILCPDTDIKGAALVAEKVRSKIEMYDFDTIGNVTSSFGVSSIKEKESMDSILKRVDSCLYKAKNQGRNCIQSI